MEQPQYTGKSDATPRRPDDSPRVEMGNEDPANERSRISRTVVWVVVACGLVVGLVLYFRFGPAVIPLFERGH